jgi:hypothetical protein
MGVRVGKFWIHDRCVPKALFNLKLNYADEPIHRTRVMNELSLPLVALRTRYIGHYYAQFAKWPRIAAPSFCTAAIAWRHGHFGARHW